MWFVNYAGLKFSTGFLNIEKLEVFYKSTRSTSINSVMKYLNFRSSVAKLESITCMFTRVCTPSEVFFKNFTISVEQQH